MPHRKNTVNVTPDRRWKHLSGKVFRRKDLADEELAQLAVVELYLPKQLSEAEVEAELKVIIAETGASSAKEMGKVMGVASKRLNGKADGKLISEIVKKLLA